jgi:hypothetical protein
MSWWIFEDPVADESFASFEPGFITVSEKALLYPDCRKEAKESNVQGATLSMDGGGGSLGPGVYPVGLSALVGEKERKICSTSSAQSLD